MEKIRITDSLPVLRLHRIPSLPEPFEGHLHPEQEIPRSMAEEMLRGGLSLDMDAHSVQLCRDLFMLRCRHDFPFWAEALVKIKPKGGGGEVPFILNAPQRMLVDRFEEMRRGNLPIRVVLLKARQWGGSTCTQLYMAWLQLIHGEGLNSLIIAHQRSGSEEIREMFERMMEHYPDTLLGIGKGERKIGPAGRSGLSLRIPSRKCKVTIGSAERPDSCRGGDYNLVHLSEVGIWKRTPGKDPEDIVRSACAGVLLTPGTMIVMESTANGSGTFFHKEYLAACRGESQFRPLFIPWYVIPQYRLPLDESGKRSLLATLESGRNSDAGSERRPSGRYLWSLYERGASLEAIAWYLQERSKYSDHARMAAEYPSDDIEAFSHSGMRVFCREGVERLRPGCIPPVAVGEVSSPMRDGEPGCLANLKFHRDSAGGLKIWRFPDENGRSDNRYLAVVDIGGRTHRADWSVILIIDRGGESGRPEVVAQWRGHCDIDLLAWNAARIAAWYGEALLVIESNSVVQREAMRCDGSEEGGYLLTQLRDEYPNLYRRGASPEAVRGEGGGRFGFHINVATKSAIISNLIKEVREGLYIERDEQCLTEFLEYERKQNGGYGAISGAHDDLLMTRAIGLYISRFEMDPCRPRVMTYRRPRRPGSCSGAPFIRF